MPLTFPGSWRFRVPISTSLNTTTIPDAALHDFIDLIQRIATQGDLQDTLELFKRHFCDANGTPNVRSSNSSWAHSDLRVEMERASTSPPLFLQAFHDACERIRSRSADLFAPDAEMINEICLRHDIGYRLEPPVLLLRGPHASVVDVPERPPTLAETALNTLNDSLHRAEELLRQGRGREAIQESLWLLETITTAFRSVDSELTVQGKYFNAIVRELRQAAPNGTLNRVLEWVTSLHGYLSSPTGGGVRHGIDLREGTALSINEARLFYNLTRSYISFMLGEHERLFGKKQQLQS